MRFRAFQNVARQADLPSQLLPGSCGRQLAARVFRVGAAPTLLTKIKLTSKTLVLLLTSSARTG